MEIGDKHEVIYAEMDDGTYVTEEMTLIKKFQYNDDKVVYIFQDDDGYLMAYYEIGDDEEIDWEFMEEINDVFIE